VSWPISGFRSRGPTCGEANDLEFGAGKADRSRGCNSSLVDFGAPGAERVNYPGLQSSAYFTRARKYLPNGQGALITFGIKEGYDAGKKLIDSLELFSLVANIGDAKSLVIHPASTTHQQLSAEQQAGTGVTPELVRLSAGIEDIRDIVADLDQASRQPTDNGRRQPGRRPASRPGERDVRRASRAATRDGR
jgi:Cys/Met metabolism PLP-dependent enzyme